MTKNLDSLAGTADDTAASSAPCVIVTDVKTGTVPSDCALKLVCQYKGSLVREPPKTRQIVILVDLNKFANGNEWGGRLDLYPAIRKIAHDTFTTKEGVLLCTPTSWNMEHTVIPPNNILLYFIDTDGDKVLIESPYALGVFLDRCESPQERKLFACVRSQFDATID